MSLHPAPNSVAEELALHLETNYGLQLDPVRHKHLVAELHEYGDRFTAAMIGPLQEDKKSA